jgi:type IX secretion system PorP/SprF family membrane protein
MKRIVLLVFLCEAASALFAQQDPQFSHYMYNMVTVNPSMVGNRGVMNMSLLHRSQWIGLEGAPESQSFSFGAPLRNNKMGLGVSIINDRIGPINQTFLYVDYSYSVRLTSSVKLSFGIKAGANWLQQRLANVNTIQSGDPSFVNSVNDNVIEPNLGSGLSIHSSAWYLGISSPRLIETDFRLSSANNDTASIKGLRHYFLVAGYVFKINPLLKIKPALQLKMTANAPFSGDFTTEVIYNDKVSFGAGYRVNDSFYGLVSYRFNSLLMAGLAYDYTTSKIRQVNDGTVEVILSYDFGSSSNKVRSPRYF